MRRRAALSDAYAKGLHEVADGVWAYLQPDGGWGWSNAGLVTGDDESLLVDTLFDLRLTAEMLEAMRRTTPAAERIATVVNTHANGDHCYGNALVAGLGDHLLGPLRRGDGAAAAGHHGRHDARRRPPSGRPASSWPGSSLRSPSRTCRSPCRPGHSRGSSTCGVGDRAVSLLEVGPAHTAGDVVVHLPDDGVVFTGDILFHGGHPIVWAGPVANWIAACDRILELQPDGRRARARPPGDAGCRRGPEGVLRVPRPRGPAPLRRRDDAAWRPRGTSTSARTPGWGEPERLVANVHALYRDFGGAAPADALTLMGEMAALAG